MRINNENGSTTDMLGDVNVVAGGFDNESMGILQDILSNVYTHTQEAVLREYVTNALDSQRKAGVTTPVEVTLPNQYEPTFRVSDHGVGLSGDEVVALFGEYVRSTKRDSNTEAGFFGIGSKVGYTETSQFTVTAVKDGIKNVVLFTLGEDGASRSLHISADIPTEERNGVTVEVPFRDHVGVAEKARRVYATLPTGSLLIDGGPNACLFDDADLTIEDGYVFKATGGYPSNNGTVHVVMGGISYTVDADWTKRLRTAAGSPTGPLYLIAEMGAVRPLPNREALRDSDSNDAWLSAQERTLPDRVAAGLERDLSKCATALDAAYRAANHPAVRGISTFHWRGTKYYTNLPLRHPLYGIEERGDTFATFTQATHTGNNHLLAGKKIGYILAADGLTSRDGLARFGASRGWDYVLVVEQPTGEDGLLSWGEGDDVVTVEQFRREAKKLRVTSKGATPSRQYRVWLPGNAEAVEATESEIVDGAVRHGRKIGFIAVDSRYDWKLLAMLAGFPVVEQKQRREPAKRWAKSGLTATDVPFAPTDWGRLDTSRSKALDALLSDVPQAEIDAAAVASRCRRVRREEFPVDDPRVSAALKAGRPDKGSVLAELVLSMGLWSRCSFADDYPALPQLLDHARPGVGERYVNDMFELQALRRAEAHVCT